MRQARASGPNTLVLVACRLGGCSRCVGFREPRTASQDTLFFSKPGSRPSFASLCILLAVQEPFFFLNFLKLFPVQ